MLKTVTYVRFQTELYVPGVGDMGKTLPSPHKNLEHLDMKVNEHGTLIVNYSIRGIKDELVIPGGNIIITKTIPEVAEIVKKSKLPDPVL